MPGINAQHCFSADICSSKEGKPERNLLAAIMGRAILDLCGETAVSSKTVASARMWIYEPLNYDEAFSFGWVSLNLNLDPLTIRHQISSYSGNREELVRCLKFLR